MTINLEKDIEIYKTVNGLKQHINPLYVIDSYCDSKESYEAFKERMLYTVCSCFRSLHLIKYPIRFKFYKDDKETHELELRRFLVNMFIWYPLVELQGIKVADSSFILKEEDILHINDFIFNTVIKAMMKWHIDQTTINHYAADIIYDLSSISLCFSLIMSLHFSDHTFIQMYDEFKDLFEMTFEDGLQPFEIEERLKYAENELVRRLTADPTNPFGVILRVGSGMKIKQLRELLVSVGLRPTLNNEIITKPIENSLLVGGLDRPSYIYIDANGARKPLLANNKDMGPIGYFCKTLNILVRTLEVSTYVFSCDSQHLVNYNVKTTAHLRRLIGKFFYDEDFFDFRQVTAKDTKLVGKKIAVKSIVTCSCSENEMCPMCIGDSINYNWDITEGFSTFITEEYSKDLEQKTLSSKHLITTNSEVIEFTDEFHRWFILQGEEIQFIGNVENIKDLAIYVNPDDTRKVEEYDPNSTYNTYIDNGKFSVVNTKTGEMIDVQIKNNKNIFIRTESSEILEKNGNMIPFKDLDENTPIFEISIENTQMVKPYYDFMSLIDSEKRDLDEVTIDNMSQKVLDIFVDGNINLTIAAGEIILNRICRKPFNVQRRPNFKRKKMPQYHFFTMSKCIEENGSPTLGLIFEQLKRQLLKIDLEKRNDTSYIDPFFKEYVSSEPIMRHREMIEEEEMRRGE